MNKYSLLFLCLIVTADLFSQDIEEYRKKYPGENAVLLDRTVHYKIKVKDDQPYVESRETEKLLYLNTNLSYMSRYSFYHSTFHEVKEYNAYTHTTANRKVKVTDFKTSNSSSGSVFYDDAKETKFDFPSLTPGATGNFEVSVVHNKPYLLSPFYFYRYIPVIKTELKISASNDIGMKYLLKGIDSSVVKIKEDRKRNETTYTFSVENLDPAKRYGDAPDESWYQPHVIFYIDNYKNEQGQVVKYLSTPKDLFKLNSSFITEVNKVPGEELTKLVDSLTAKVTDATEKTRMIYQWVQKNIKYIAFEDGMGGFVPRDANIVLHRRYGDCKDMASLLTMMLNKAKVPAYYTWIGTRDIAYTYEETPLPIVDNHMICVANPAGKMIFLDGTDPSCVFGSIPEHIQDKEAMVALSNDEYKILKVPTRGVEENVFVDSTYLTLGSGGITGKINQHLKGYFATNMHYSLKYVQAKDQTEKMKRVFSRGSNKFQLNDFVIGDRSEMNELKLSADFSLNDYARKAGDEWLVNMNLVKPFQGEEIDYPKRRIPVEKDFLYTNKYVVVMNIPEGFTASFVPDGKKFENELWGFSTDYKVVNNKVIYTVQFQNNRLMININEFEKWNKVLEVLHPLYKEIVILSKK